MTEHATVSWEEAEREGTRLRLGGKSVESIGYFQTALRRFPGNIALMNGLGLALLDGNRPGDACEVLQEAVRCLPGSAPLVFNLGNALRANGDATGAVGAYERSIALGLDRPEVWNNLGIAWQGCDRWDDALRAFGEALRRDARYLPALENTGYSLMQTGRPEEAVPYLRRAVEQAPGSADAHWLLSHALLVTGRWPEGWDEYEWRWHRMHQAVYHRGDQRSRWNGEDIAGKSVLLYAEQGIGDAVQFARYATLVAAMGATVFIECHAGLVPLFRGLNGVAGVFARGDVVPLCDVACPLLSLPAVFRTTPETIPLSVPYLVPDAGRVARWRRVLGGEGGVLRVGLVWAGNASHVNDRKRSVSSSLLSPLAVVSGVEYYSLQKGEPGDRRCAPPPGLRMIACGEGLEDFADTAALVSLLDLVITVDTAVAHIAGALGRPVWMMVPFVPDWRWLLERSTSPWYPSMRLFRQPSQGDWGAVISAISARLRAFSDALL